MGQTKKRKVRGGDIFDIFNGSNQSPKENTNWFSSLFSSKSALTPQNVTGQSALTQSPQNGTLASTGTITPKTTGTLLGGRTKRRRRKNRRKKF